MIRNYIKTFQLRVIILTTFIPTVSSVMESTESLANNDSSEQTKNTIEEVPLVNFQCSVCGLSEKCRFGRVKVKGRTHTYEYHEEVYYMMDPFRNRSKVDPRRLNLTDQKTARSQEQKSVNIMDFFVLGSLCSICGLPVCIDELCSVFYSKTFCMNCFMKEKAQFPVEIASQVESVRAAREKREKERKGYSAPVVEE